MHLIIPSGKLQSIVSMKIYIHHYSNNGSQPWIIQPTRKMENCVDKTLPKKTNCNNSITYWSSSIVDKIQWL